MVIIRMGDYIMSKVAAKEREKEAMNRTREKSLKKHQETIGYSKLKLSDL